MASRLTRSAVPKLAVVIHGQLAGHVFEAGNRRLTFRYLETWRTSRGAIPLSVAMPLSTAEHGHRVTSAWLWGVLPDNPTVIERWARAAEVSRHDVVRILARVGEDCAGAVQFIPPDRLHEVLGAPTATDEREQIDWLSGEQVERLLADLRRDPAAGRPSSDRGQFSLAGAQPKTTLYQTPRGRWGIPRGRVPSNRILKPPVLALDDLAWNEHACLLLARTLGLAASTSRVEHFGDELAIVVERYDRVRLDGVLHRVHQEDGCQALGIMPTRKYETDRGPGAVAIATLIARHSTAPRIDIARFVDALLFNWLIGGSDAHAKNFALLHGARNDVRLAPLYDLISALPYPTLGGSSVRLAMAIDGERSIDRIEGSHWRGLARAVGDSPERVMDRIAELTRRTADAVEEVVAHHDDDPRAQTTIRRLLKPTMVHARAIARR